MDDIFSKYQLFNERVKLYNDLKDRGFYVRMHAYEYIIGDYKKFKALILIEPFRNIVYVKVLDKNDEEAIKTIIQSIKSGDSQIRIVTF